MLLQFFFSGTSNLFLPADDIFTQRGRLLSECKAMGTLYSKFKERDPHNQSVAVAVLLILANVKVLPVLLIPLGALHVGDPMLFLTFCLSC
jgi:hypothetical protein